jgi:hypothetical protein
MPGKMARKFAELIRVRKRRALPLIKGEQPMSAPLSIPQEQARIPAKLDAEKILKYIGALVTLGGFLWGITSFLITARIEAETRSLDARKPFLEKQLALYTEATQVVSVLATSEDADALAKNRQRFWELYVGELAMVENGGLDARNRGVAEAMGKFSSCLNRECARGELRSLAVDLAHACRDSLALSWGVADWRTP